jgi:nitrous oxide reductase accessory protein NosL
MKAIHYPKFSCAVQFTDRTTYYFCGNGCMMRAWVNPEKFLKRGKNEIAFVVVRDYFSGRQTDGKSVTWVSGSDVIGPMGPTPVPLENKAHVQTFLKRHGGKKTFRLSELNTGNIAVILGKRP